jgi:hypothetical protein
MTIIAFALLIFALHAPQMTEFNLFARKFSIFEHHTQFYLMQKVFSNKNAICVFEGKNIENFCVLLQSGK